MYSQAGQDKWVLSQIDKGIYLEIGASHPINISNTYLLEKHGWKGWSLDINNQCEQIWHKERSNPLIIHDALTLDYSFLPDRIDYLQVDTDPAPVSLKVLMALPKTTRFSLITFEHDYYYDKTVRDKSRNYLKSLGYTLAKADVEYEGQPFEDWWIDKTII